MNRDQAKEYIQNHAAELLTADGSGKGYICPICNSGSGKNGTGITTKDGTHFTCWTGCYTNADIIDIIGLQYGESDYSGKLERTAELMGLTIDNSRDYTPRKPDTPLISERTEPAETDYTDFFLQANSHIDETEYHRGISSATLNRFKVGYVAEWRHPKAPNAPTSPRLIIPTSKYSYLARDTRAELTDTQKKYSKSKVGKTHLFNIKALQTATTPVFIVEGEIDALSIIDVGGEAVGLGSVVMIKTLLNLLAKQTPTQPLIIALDNDQAGEKNISKLTEGLKSLNISFTIYQRFNGFKDANDALTSNREDFKKAVFKAIESAENKAEDDREEIIAELRRESVAYSLQDFRNDIKASESVAYYPTGFSELDELLDGGLYPGLYIVGAISSLGKTTFCLQIADQVAKAGNDVLIFSLEMARNELIAKSISRLTFTINKGRNGDEKDAKTTRGILTGSRYSNYSPAELDLIAAAIDDYSYYSEHIYINEGIGDIGVEQIRERVARHKKITGKSPVIIIDYLQILAPYDIKATDKQNTDKAVMELKRLSRDYSAPIIGISSFNRDNYTAPVNLTSFKESGAIEYSSDVLIGLQYEGMDYKTGEKDGDRQKRIRKLLDDQTDIAKEGKAQTVQVKVLKNRNGSKGDAALQFVPMFNYFYETSDFEEIDDGGEWEVF